MEDLAELVAANEDAAAAITAAYAVLMGGVPNIDGYTLLINNILETNYGSNDPSIEFNQENAFINVVNSLVQGNPAALASFQAITAGAASLADQVTAIYKAMVPFGSQSAEGLAYLTRPEALAFYEQVAAERGVAGPDGAAIVALASILNIAYENDIPGIGDAVNDFLAAVQDGSAQIPQDGDVFTPIETADGTNFDGDDFGVATVLTTGIDQFVGSATNDLFQAPTVQTALLPNQTLNSGDSIDGGGGRNTLWAQLSDFIVQPAALTNIQHLSLENAPLALGLALGPRVVDAIHADAIDTVSFRAPNASIISGLGVTNVSTVVNTVNINDSGSNLGGFPLPGGDHFISFIGDALDGDADSVQVNLSNVFETSLTLMGAYELATINSTGPVENVFALAIETLEELSIIGDADLWLADLEIDPLNLVDASVFEGNLDAEFVNDIDAGEDGNPDGVNDVIEVIGGLGDDDIGFSGDFDSDATVSLGAGDDVVWFGSIGGAVTFTETDSVDGGDGEDWLSIEAQDNGADPLELLLDGVGDNIVDIEGIEHYGTLLDHLLVDWTRSGSAAILELDGNYNDFDVIVTELTNDDTVSVYGDDFRDLSVSSLNGAGSLSNAINLEFNVDTSIDRIDIHRDLIVDTDTELLNLAVNGLGYVEIDGADLIDSDITITGDADLSLGLADGAYDLGGGTIDGSAATGDLWVALGLGHQSISGGSGDDLFIVAENGTGNTDRIFLAAGGDDTVQYSQVVALNGAELLNAATNPQINGFSIEGDVIALDEDALGLENLGGAGLADTDPAVIADIAQGLAYVLPNAVNLLKFTTAFTGAADATIEQAYDFVIGGGTVTAVTPDGGDDDILAMFYDATNEQAVLFRIFENGATQDVISNDDRVDLISTIDMSASDYAAFSAANIDFV